MADQTNDEPCVLKGDGATYIVGSVVTPKLDRANEHHRRLVSASHRLGWATLGLGMVAIAAFSVASPLRPAVVGVMAALAAARFMADRLVSRSGEGRRSLATIEESLHRWLMTSSVSWRDRVNTLDYCDLTATAVLLKSLSPLDRQLPASVRLPAIQTLARGIVIDSNWQPHLLTLPTLRSMMV